MPWKMNGEQFVVKDGHPVWISDDGKESGIDAGSILKRLTEVTGESMGRKTKIRELETSLEVLNGIENPKDFMSKAKKAMETVQNLDDKQLIDAGKVDEITTGLKDQLASAQSAYDNEVAKLTKIIADKDKSLQTREIRSLFEQSEYLKENAHYPPNLLFDSFNRNFKIEEKDGNVEIFAIRADGSEVTSQDVKTIGKRATSEEAFEILINEHPNAAEILKGASPGSGTSPITPGGGSSISRQQFDGLPAEAKSKHVSAGGTVKD